MRRCWSDNDKNCGPFTFARDGFSRLGLILDTGDLEEGSASLRLHFCGRTFLAWLPRALPIGRQYGAFYSSKTVHFHYGRHAMDSRADRSKCWFVPWLNWRHVRTSVYGIDGSHFATEEKGNFSKWMDTRRACPSRMFTFLDYDGERIEATTRIEEREWRLGTGWFRWLSWFRRSNVRRSLDIEFSAEVGPGKGSWKGGTIGHGIDMLPGELHRTAFCRYCREHGLTFVAELDAKGRA